MNLRTKFSSGTVMTEFLAGKQTTLLSSSAIYDNKSDLHIFDDQEISEKLKKLHIEKTGKK